MGNRLLELYKQTMRELEVKEALDNAKAEFEKQDQILKQYRRVLQKEKHDVDKLQHVSITKLITSLKGTLEEDLETEIREYNDAKRMYYDLEQKRNELKQVLDELQYTFRDIQVAKQEFDTLYERKRRLIERNYPDIAAQISNYEKTIHELKQLILEDRKEQQRQEDQVRNTVMHKSLPLRNSLYIAQVSPERVRSSHQTWSNSIGKRVDEQRGQMEIAFEDVKQQVDSMHKASDETDNVYQEINQLETQIFDLIVMGEYSEKS